MQHTSSPAALAHLSPGIHLPVEIAVPVVVVVVVLKLASVLRKGRSPVGAEIIVRCSKGHLFETYWSPWGSFTSIRLGFARFQYCPVGDHWSLVRPVKDSDLTDEDRRMVEQMP
jgi:hypothetical protein